MGKDDDWVQTDVSAHKAWAMLGIRSPKACAILHYFCSLLMPGVDPVVTVSHESIARRMRCDPRTVRRAVGVLEELNFVQVLRTSKGQKNSFRLNSRVAWTMDRRDILSSHMSSVLVVDHEDQTDTSDKPLQSTELFVDGNAMPIALDDEEQLDLL